MKFNQSEDFSPATHSESKIQRIGFTNRFSEWIVRHPILSIILVAGLAVVINCYPVIFCKRSYVCQTSMGAMVYSWWPPLPGNDPTPYVSQHGSDTAAMMIWGVPAGFIESRSLWQHGELPLWNRYGHTGDTLIGQAVSMLGDPLQWIVIAGHGCAEAWDIKFLAAKFLFCIGFGWLILRLFGNYRLALVYAALAAYCGAFFYINNHPVFFVFCYAPWILLSALAWLNLETGWNIRWLVVWLLVNFACFNAGHVEVAVVLIGGLNLAAVTYILAICRSVAKLLKVLGCMAAGTLLFLGLTAPMWMSFFTALDGSYTVHSVVQVNQLEPICLLGAFDDLFYLLLRENDSMAALAPGTSLLVLAGCCLAGLRWRQLKTEPFFWINTSALVVWGGCVFGWVPASLLIKIPMLNRISHIYTDFSYLLVIHLTIQSAYGFKALAAEKNFRRVVADFLWLGLGFGGIMLAYCFGTMHQPIPWDYFLCAMAGALGSPLLFMFLKSQPRTISAIGWAAIIILAFIPHFRFGLYSFGNEKLQMLPGRRVVLNASSEAVEKIKASNSDPFRVVGLGSCFFGDYSAVYGIEDIRSCAPISSGEYIDLVCRFPGMELAQGWVIDVADISAAQPLLNMLNVKYLMANPRTQIDMDKGAAFRIADRSDFLVLENLQVWPRAFFANRVLPSASSEDFIKLLLENGRQPFVALTPAEIKKLPGLQPLAVTNQATISPASNYRLSVNATEFDVHASSAGVVCLTEGQANDFTAAANHEPKKVLTVNRAFKGIYLDQPGDYHIEFTYRPRHWRLACTLFWISTGGIVMVMLISVRATKIAKRRDYSIS